MSKPKKSFKTNDIIYNSLTGEKILVTEIDNTPGISHWTEKVCPECGAEAYDEYDGAEEHCGYHCSKCDWTGEECKKIQCSMPYSASMTVERDYGSVETEVIG